MITILPNTIYRICMSAREVFAVLGRPSTPNPAFFQAWCPKEPAQHLPSAGKPSLSRRRKKSPSVKSVQMDLELGFLYEG